MHRLQEVVRLHRMGCSARVIARHLRMSRNTVQRYLEALERGGLLAGEPSALPALATLPACVEAEAPPKTCHIDIPSELATVRGC